MMMMKQVTLLSASTLCLVWGVIAIVKSVVDTDSLTIESLRTKTILSIQAESDSRSGKSGSEEPAVPTPVTASPFMDHSALSITTTTYNLTSSKWSPPAFESSSLLASSLNKRPRPIPVQVLEQYQEWHSVDSLRRNPHNRRFSVVFYSCPLQAGNRIHHFLTGMLWSILTNRTMLWKYWDTETCYQYGWAFSQVICRDANTAADCDPIFARAPWIASYDEWHDKLNLPEPTELPFYATHPQKVIHNSYPWGPGNNAQSRGVDVKYNNIPVAIFAQTRFKISFMKDTATANSLLHSEWSRTTNAKLHSQGVDFLFGMLQRYSFELTDHMKASIPEIAHKLQGPNYYTIALHSRHIDPTYDGCDITREQQCIRQLARKFNSKQQQQQNKRRCVVNLMSDRSCTISTLTPWLQQEQGCHVLVAAHDKRVDYSSEHGPFSGAGFFQDMALASTARSAFIGLKRSSSDLVLELLVFSRKMEAWQAGQDMRLVDLDFCLLRKIPPPDEQKKAYLRQFKNANYSTTTYGLP